MSAPVPLAREQLSHRCDAGSFDFRTTEELEIVDDVVGQERAAQAIYFAVDIDREGFNLFVMGPPGSGKHTLARRATARRAAGASRPPDWIYVNNFDDPQRPIAIDLPPGRATSLREDVNRLIEELRTSVPAAFESEEYSSRVESIDAEFKERHEKAFSSLGEEAINQKIALLRTPAGFSFAPLKDGAVIGPDDFAQLPEAERERIEKAMAELQAKLEKIVREVMRWRKERFERIKALNREMTLLVTGHLVEEIRRGYTSLPKVLAWLDAVQADILENADDFRKAPEGSTQILRLVQREEPSLRRYVVNVLVDHAELCGESNGLPVVEADHPTYPNLVGRVDHVAEFGTLVTNFSLIKAGALHRANGGFLLLDAEKLLMQPYAWEGLKRALLRREIRVESLGEIFGMVSTVSLAPEPIPLKLKIILFGDRRLYYLLQEYDPDFRKYFRVAVDFEDDFERGADGNMLYARLIGSLARREGLLPLRSEAVARTIDFGSRFAGDSRKLTASLRRVSDLLKEADHYARTAGSADITADEVRRAADAQRHRADRVHVRLQEAIARGTLLIDTDGARVGQVNGLAIYELADFAFAEPARITATTRLGDGRVIDIQREVELGGAIHSKGVMILSSFLAARFSGNRPLSLVASLAFEQTYGTVEGDSASLAELCALLSSLSDIPVRQSLAVTGSVNQLGEVQAIGAVNEKIEGFFDICNARGLTGGQGVVIPAANIDHLMLREDVVEASSAGRFHVYAVRTVDEAIELLTGIPAGDADPGQTRTVNGRVAGRLLELSMLRRGALRPGQVMRSAGARKRRDAE